MQSESGRGRTILLAGMIAMSAATTDAQEVRFDWIPKGFSGRTGYYQPVRLDLTEKQPESVTKLPEGVDKPLFGVLKFGPAESLTSCALLLHEPKKGESKLWIDANSNGDLTDDPAVRWTSRKNKQGSVELFQWNGAADFKANYGTESQTLALHLYRFDPDDPQRQQFKNSMFYYRDFGYAGKLKLGDKEYSAALVDDSSKGDFRGEANEKDSKVSVLIDLNSSGDFDLRGERFDVRQPFNIAGITREFTGLTAKGGTFEIKLSEKSVPEKTIPAVVKKGKQPPAFEVKSLDGKTIKFPQDFEGRLVMLDFWATWCGPCRDELPNLRRVYDEFHAQGFDILSVSIDEVEDAADADRLAKFIKTNGMDWQHTNDPHRFEGKLPTTYGITGIPACWLVDGKSGLIVADSSSLRGDALRGTIERRLEQLGQPPSDDPNPAHAPKSEDPLAAKAREVVGQGGFTNGTQFRDMRKSPTPGDIATKPAATQPLRGREIAQRASDAYVRCGWVFHCSKCNKWHLQLAGGYAIAPDTIVSAFHVMTDPGASKLDEAHPIVVIGEDQIVPIKAVLAASSEMDTIVMRVATTELKPLALNSDSRVGDAVFCFSDPQGIRGYFSAGMVNRHFSLKAGSKDPKVQRVHVSADWSKGSSGSAVLDDCGNAIGHVVRIQSLFLNPNQEARANPTVLNLHEAVPAASVQTLLTPTK